MDKAANVELGRSAPYEEWIESQNISVIRDFHIPDLSQVELSDWAWKAARGVYLNLIGTGDTNDAYILEIAPGGSVKPQRMLFEELIFVISGYGSTVLWNDEDKNVSFEWQPGSLFSPPVNTWRQHFNASGVEPARFLVVTSAPVLFNLFRNRDFILNNPVPFTERFGGEADSFSGKGEAYKFKATTVWETNFIPDVRSIPLHPRANRGAGGSFLGIELGGNSMTAHISEFPVGTYKKAHRHGAGAHVIIIGGQGYSLMWPEGEEPKRFDWRDGSVIVPPERWFHQHFNTGLTPARYLALRWGSRKYPRAIGKNYGTDESVKNGGDQIEYGDEDPEILRMFEEELAKNGAVSHMDEVFSRTL